MKQNFESILQCVRLSREKEYKVNNTKLIELYYEIGKSIHKQIQNGTCKKSIVKDLADFIKSSEPELKGFSDKNLWRIKQFYVFFSKNSILLAWAKELSFTNIIIILSKVKNNNDIEFYLKKAIKERLTKRELSQLISESILKNNLPTKNRISPLARELNNERDFFINLGIHEPYLSELLNHFIIEYYKKDDFLLKAGTICKYIAFMKTGSARTYYLKENGEEISFLLQYDQSYLTDYESVLLNAESKINIQFLCDSEVFLLPTSTLKLLYQQDDFWIKYAKKVTDMVYLEARSRIEDFLYLDAKERYEKLLKKSPEIFQRIPQKYIASYLGIKPQSLSRLKTLKR